jgi:hypothetical protein
MQRYLDARVRERGMFNVLRPSSFICLFIDPCTCLTIAQEHKVEWLHVDYEPHLARFYEECGFRHTEGGIIYLASP